MILNFPKNRASLTPLVALSNAFRIVFAVYFWVGNLVIATSKVARDYPHPRHGWTTTRHTRRGIAINFGRIAFGAYIERLQEPRA